MMREIIMIGMHEKRQKKGKPCEHVTEVSMMPYIKSKFSSLSLNSYLVIHLYSEIYSINWLH